MLTAPAGNDNGAEAPAVGAVAPGANRAHHLSRADWRFLLPPLTGARVLCLGVPTAGELSALRSAAVVVVAVTSQAEGEPDLDRVPFVRVDANAALPLRAGAFDFVVVVERPTARALAFPCPAHRDLHRVLAPGARVIVTTALPGGAALVRRWLRLCLRERPAPQVYWALWRKGSMRAAAPLASAGPIGRYLLSNVLYGRSRAGRLLAPAGAALARTGLLHRMLTERSLVAAPGGVPVLPFEHLVAVADRHGIDLQGHAIALLASGNYDSNKNAFFAFPAGAAEPDLLFKVTRTAVYNHRLAAEHDALQLLHEGGYVPAGTYPEAAFLDRFGELALLGQKVVPGVPFRRATTARAHCPAARNGIEWLTRLGERSALHHPANRDTLVERVDALLARVASTYSLTCGERGFLADRIERLARAEAAVPLVFRHADAGTWNVLVTPAGDVAFLDWEVAERDGPPLWDLLDFVQSHGSWAARVAGVSDPVAGYGPLFTQTTDMLQLLRDAVQHYVARVGLDPADVEPLFYTYWLDRADRQSAWAVGPLADASYIRLLRHCIAQRGSPGLRSLLD